jgi:hypothetical protein
MVALHPLELQQDQLIELAVFVTLVGLTRHEAFASCSVWGDRPEGDQRVPPADAVLDLHVWRLHARGSFCLGVCLLPASPVAAAVWLAATIVTTAVR